LYAWFMITKRNLTYDGEPSKSNHARKVEYLQMMIRNTESKIEAINQYAKDRKAEIKRAENELADIHAKIDRALKQFIDMLMKKSKNKVFVLDDETSNPEFYKTLNQVVKNFPQDIYDTQKMVQIIELKSDKAIAKLQSNSYGNEEVVNNLDKKLKEIIHKFTNAVLGIYTRKEYTVNMIQQTQVDNLKAVKAIYQEGITSIIQSHPPGAKNIRNIDASAKRLFSKQSKRVQQKMDLAQRLTCSKSVFLFDLEGEGLAKSDIIAVELVKMCEAFLQIIHILKSFDNADVNFMVPRMIADFGTQLTAFKNKHFPRYDG